MILNKKILFFIILLHYQKIQSQYCFSDYSYTLKSLLQNNKNLFLFCLLYLSMFVFYILKNKNNKKQINL